MELKVFSNPAVAAELQKNFVLLKVDLTNEDDQPNAGAIKAKYGVNTLPAVRIATATGTTIGRLNQFTPPDEFLTELARVRAIR
jgi:thiol:disulfide interchange protein